VSTGLSPNPSPEVGGALIQDNSVYFDLNFEKNIEFSGLPIARFYMLEIWLSKK
jgi:hypothetical protein